MIPVLLLDHDAEFRGMVADELRAAGFEPAEAGTVAEAEAMVLRGMVRFEALVLNVSLPDGDGCDLCARLPAACQGIPVLLLADTDAEDDVVPALMAGAHDRMAKPFRPSMLVARLRTHLRRHENSTDAVLTVGRWRFYPAQKVLRDQTGQCLRLTATEAHLLRYLVQRADRTITRQELLANVLGYSPAASTHTLQTHIYQLRQKIEVDPGAARLLVTTNVGYRLAAQAG